ncbi:siderophore-interacting protein [Rhodococcoides yunnanense]|jgi:NADPH-dependent ferric siderophore reductase|uniref:siderophore-interacting protein n=1 Tax=Rhodococcoides yunnanense TaxID=278209 RepID=UPI0022B1343D|nr:siderophore-interacting protein [Rhodococcus yunnanensis]MCZ4277461.1 siderophore-interacting protein [Rhodococcus yunnanensis]
MSRGVEGFIMKAYRADDYTLTVTYVEPVTDKYIRVGFTADGLLQNYPVHPTQWIRLWFDDGSGRQRQRGYTLVRQDPATDSFAIEFAVHYGPASVWAENAKAGDVIEASLLKGTGSSNFSIPEPTPPEFLIFGDTASLPAINTLLDAIGDVPARVCLEWQYESDVILPVHAHGKTELTWLQRVDDGRLVREHAESTIPAPGSFAWIACDGRTTRSIVKTLRAHGLAKESIKAQAYWK